MFPLPEEPMGPEEGGTVRGGILSVDGRELLGKQDLTVVEAEEKPLF